MLQVEQLLRSGPDGVFLVKNSTEFPGDLTLCLYKVREKKTWLAGLE